MGAFAFVTFLLAITRPREERYGATLRTVAGIATPVLVTVAYFIYHGALGDFLDGFILFNVLYLVRGSINLAPQLLGAAGNIIVPYSTMLVPILIGLVMIVRLYFQRPFQYRFLPIVVSFPAPVLWSLRDFQLADDFFVFLPYAAIGFGAFLAAAVRRADNQKVLTVVLSAILLSVALANTSKEISASAAHKLVGTTIDLPAQREGAQEIQERFGDDVKLASINSPQVMVLLHRVNPNPYLWITAGVDNRIEARTPGGFEGWLEGLGEFDPDAISFFGDGQSLLPSAHLSPEHYQELDSWLDQRYRAVKVGPWWLFVKKDVLMEEAQRKASTESYDTTQALNGLESQ
jgi:hypothetical protein